MTDLETTATLPVLATLETKIAAETRLLGQALVPLLKAGDLLILEGELGAGKTTFTRGLGAGLQAQQRTASPTFIIAHARPVAPGSGLAPLTHMDAYRLQAGDGIESLNLDSVLEDSAVAVERDKGKAERASPRILMVEIMRPETTSLPGSDFMDIPENAPCVLTFRASAGTWDLSGPPVA